VPQTQYLPRFAGEVDPRERSDRWSGGGPARHARSLRLTPPGSLHSIADALRRRPLHQERRLKAACTSPFRGGIPRLCLDNRKPASISARRALVSRFRRLYHYPDLIGRAEMARSALVIPTPTWSAITKGRARHDFRAGQLDVARHCADGKSPCGDGAGRAMPESRHCDGPRGRHSVDRVGN
jgi:hypothetical protein